MQREKEFAKNSAILSIGTIVPKFTSLITLPIITGCLTKAEYGTYDLITILVALFLPVATLQMQAAAFRFLIDARGNREEQTKIISCIVAFVLPVSVTALLILYFFLGRMQISTRILVLLYFLVDTLLISARQIARGLGKNLIYSVSALINALLEMAGMFILLSIRREGLNGAVLALLGAQTASLVYLLISAKICSFVDLKTVSTAKIKNFLAYSWPMVPNALSSWVMRASDRLILSWFMGVEATAIYAAANKLPTVFHLVQSTFTLAWQENAAVSVNDRDSGEYYGKMFDSVFNFFAGAMGILIAFTPITFRLLIRGDYSESYNHMPILYIAELFTAVSAYLGGIYAAHMKSRQIGVTTTIAAAMNFLINILFVKRIGIYAASLSTLISYLWLAVYRMIDIQKIQRIRFHTGRIAVLTLCLVGIAYATFLRIPALDIANILFSIAFAVCLNRALIGAMLNGLRRRLFK